MKRISVLGSTGSIGRPGPTISRVSPLMFGKTHQDKHNADDEEYRLSAQRSIFHDIDGCISGTNSTFSNHDESQKPHSLRKMCLREVEPFPDCRDAENADDFKDK